MLARYEQETAHQIVILIIPGLNGEGNRRIGPEAVAQLRRKIPE
jgi:hypothetical protein